MDPQGDRLASPPSTPVRRNRGRDRRRHRSRTGLRSHHPYHHPEPQRSLFAHRPLYAPSPPQAVRRCADPSRVSTGNILILRGDILINPPHRPSVSYSYLSSLVGDYLLRLLSSSSSDDPDRALSAALEILPSTRYGLNLNPRFASIDGFRPTTTSATTSPSQGAEGSVTGELALFALSKVPLLHGWVVDPQDEETWEVLVGEAGDYDHAVEMVVEGEVVSGGLDESGERTEEEVLALVAKRSLWTPADEKKVRTGSSPSRFFPSPFTTGG